MKKINNSDDLINKIKSFSKDKNLDLSQDEDLSIAIMNLISLEEHFFFSGAKTKNKKYFDLLNQVRLIRTQLLKKIIKEYEGEVWCVSKHLLAASMRLIEVGTKSWKKGEKGQAQDFFAKAYDLYSLFWGLNLKLVSMGKVEKIDDNKLDIHDKESKSLLSKLGDIVKKAIDCCKE